MSATETAVYDVTLSQLALDARAAGIEYPSAVRDGLSRKELRTLLKAAGALAPSISYPLTPELRVVTSAGNFVIQFKEGRLNLVSWASMNSRGGGATTPEQILAIITGEVMEGDAGLAEEAAPVARATGKGWKRAALVVLLVAAVVAINSFTFVQAKKPPGKFLPPYRVMEPAPSERALATVAGNYETGSQPGDRRLQIARDGNVTWIKFGQGRTPAESKTFTVKAVEAAGSPALLTSRESLIKIKDPTTLLLFGDTYVRVAQ